MLRLVVFFWMLATPTFCFANDMVRLAVTTSFHNSGLADRLLPAIKQDLGLDVQLLVVGTGQALRLGRAGDVDALLVHSRAAEEAFVADGYGTHRTEVMYNDFVVLGPRNDPANVRSASDARDAFSRLEATMAPFVSRGDDSGTHRKELSLWERSVAVQNADWYKEVGAGMGAALNIAAGLDAYVLADRASWLNFSNKGSLRLLFSGDPELFNQYSFLPVNPDRHSHVRADLVQKLEAWLVSDSAQALIDGYQLQGQALFVFNAN